MTTELERRYKRAHWRACRRLIEAHRGEFLRLLEAERAAQAEAPRAPLPDRAVVALRHHHQRARGEA